MMTGGTPIYGKPHMEVSIVMGVPKNGWFMSGKILLENRWWLGVPLFMESPIWRFPSSCGYPKMAGLCQGKSFLKIDDDWGYPYLWEAPYGGFRSHGGTPSHHLFSKRIFHDINHLFCGYSHDYGNPHMWCLFALPTYAIYDACVLMILLPICDHDLS